MGECIVCRTATSQFRTLAVNSKHGLQQVRGGAHMLPAGKEPQGPALMVMVTAPICMFRGCLSVYRTSCEDKVVSHTAASPACAA